MSKHDALYIAKFQPRGRKAKNVKPRKARKAIRKALRHYEAINRRWDGEFLGLPLFEKLISRKLKGLV